MSKYILINNLHELSEAITRITCFQENLNKIKRADISKQ